MANTIQPVWFITGCSTGFGRELVQCSLQGLENLVENCVDLQ
ncbi:MAG: hypothetical protein ACR2KZ_05530 [Segetibacter sp.]